MSEESQAPQSEPAVVDGPAAVSAAEDRNKKKKKKKRKTTSGLRDLQTMARRMTKAAHRMARAVENGVATYRERSEDSAEKKRDGALRDLPRNTAEAMSVAIEKASRLPVDLVNAVDVPTTRRLVRFGTRILLMPLPR